MDTLRCECGRAATTEIQTGYDPAANGGVGGGVYTPLCDGCYDLCPEGVAYRQGQTRLRVAESLGIDCRGMPPIMQGYGAHPRAAEIGAAHGHAK